MPIVLIIAYVVLSALIGFLGRRREIGFAGFFVLSLLITPFITALILLVAAPRSPIKKS
jgi:hypothetical protein